MDSIPTALLLSQRKRGILLLETQMRVPIMRSLRRFLTRLANLATRRRPEERLKGRD